MSEFQLYFGLGKDHILDYSNGYDHILFIVALCVLYQLRDWRQVLVLVTAFTIGHSITLALATLNIITVKAELIEFLIPVTIFITAASNIIKKEDSFSGRAIQINYLYAGFFWFGARFGFFELFKKHFGEE